MNSAGGNPLLRSSAQHRSRRSAGPDLLDRAHFSPGEIDGRYGGTTRSAAAAFNLSKKIKGHAEVNAATWQALNLDGAPAIVPYTLTAADLAGPFAPIPEEMAGRPRLDRSLQAALRNPRHCLAVNDRPTAAFV